MFKFFKNSKRFVKERFVLTAVTFLAAFSLMKVPVTAASFVHNHTDSCYSNVQRWCDQSDHIVVSSNYTQEGYCPNCGCTVTLECCDYYNTCRYSRQSPMITGTRKMCSRCYSVLEDGMGDVSGHYYTSRECICGLSEGQAIAYVSLGADCSEWTNGNVTLNVNVSGSVALAGSPYNFGGGYGTSSSIEVSENGTYSVSVMAANGAVVSEAITVSNIDKEAPVITALSKDTEGWIETGLTVSVEASDALSGLDALAYSFDSGEWSAGNTIFVTENREVTVAVRDLAGNIATGSITVANIGRDPAVVAAEEASRRAAEAEALSRQQEAEEKARREAMEQAERAEAERAEAARLEAEALKREANDKVTTSSGKNTANSKSGSTGKTSESNSKSQIESTKGNEEASAQGENSISENELFENDDCIVFAAENDISTNDISSNMVPVYDFSSSDGPLNLDNYHFDGEFSPDNDSFNISKTQASKPFNISYKELVMAGSLLIILGAVLVLGSTYIYTKTDGHISLLSPAKLKNENGKNVVLIPQGKLSKGGNYRIFYSPLSNIKAGTPVYVRVENSKEEILCDSKKSFTYSM